MRWGSRRTAGGTGRRIGGRQLDAERGGGCGGEPRGGAGPGRRSAMRSGGAGRRRSGGRGGRVRGGRSGGRCRTRGVGGGASGSVGRDGAAGAVGGVSWLWIQAHGTVGSCTWTSASTTSVATASAGPCPHPSTSVAPRRPGTGSRRKRPLAVRRTVGVPAVRRPRWPNVAGVVPSRPPSRAGVRIHCWTAAPISIASARRVSISRRRRRGASAHAARAESTVETHMAASDTAATSKRCVSVIGSDAERTWSRRQPPCHSRAARPNRAHRRVSPAHRADDAGSRYRTGPAGRAERQRQSDAASRRVASARPA